MASVAPSDELFVCCCCNRRVSAPPSGTCAACLALGVDDCADSSLCPDCVGNHRIQKKKYDGHVVLQAGEADPTAVALQPYDRQPVGMLCSTHLSKKRLYQCGSAACANALLCEECLPGHLGHRESVKALGDVAAGLKTAIEASFFLPPPDSSAAATVAASPAPLPAPSAAASSAPLPAAAASKPAAEPAAALDARITLVDAARDAALRVAAVRRSLIDAVPTAAAAISSAQEALVRAVVERCAELCLQLDSAHRTLALQRRKKKYDALMPC
jgi:hypothetical protein